MSANELISTGRRRRRRHSELFKAEAVGACQQQEGVSIAAVALARGLNANLLRSWVRKAERGNAPIAIGRSVPDPVQRAHSFVPVTLPTDAAERPIRVELCRKGRKVSIEWPASAAHECARLLRELMK